MDTRKEGGEVSSTARKAACGTLRKGGATPPASTKRKQRDRIYTRRAVAMMVARHEKVPWRTSAIPATSEEREKWVRENPATSEEIMEYVRMFSKSLPRLAELKIDVDILMVNSSDDMRAMMVVIRDWAERTAFRMEPHVIARKGGLAAPFADLHVITQSIDCWIERHDKQTADGV